MEDTDSARDILPNGPQNTGPPASEHEAPSTNNLAPTPSTRNSEPIKDAEPPKQQDSSTSETATPNALELATPAALETEDRGFESHRPTNSALGTNFEKSKTQVAQL